MDFSEKKALLAYIYLLLHVVQQYGSDGAMTPRAIAYTAMAMVMFMVMPL